MRKPTAIRQYHNLINEVEFPLLIDIEINVVPLESGVVNSV